MNAKLKTFLLSLLTPGLGYYQNGDKRSFYKTIICFYSVIISGTVFRLFTTFNGLLMIAIALIAVYVFTVIHATIKARETSVNNNILKICFTMAFILTTGISFANKRTVLGFDIMSMDVPVMQPSVLENEKFLVNTWIYKYNSPKRGDIIVHSFAGQSGLYLNRIIAIAKDKIEIKNGIVIVNGQRITEPYVLSKNATKQESRSMKEVTVATGHYFVMGDNRDKSFGDSRFSGTITGDNIVGKITDLIYSQDKSRIGETLR